jgi:hypothetical protein
MVCAIRETFTREIKAFLKDLIRVFPDDRDMKLVSSTVNIALMDEPDDIIAKLYKMLAPFEDLIDVRDPEFFIRAQVDDADIPIFSKLTFYWENLAQENRKCVWDYIQVLYRLSKKICA